MASISKTIVILLHNRTLQADPFVALELQTPPPDSNSLSVTVSMEASVGWDSRGGSLCEIGFRARNMKTEEMGNGASCNWFALCVKSRAERVVAAIARNKGYEVFLPLYHCRHRWSDRHKSVELPLLPGYVFCRLDPRYRLPLLTTPSALHFVGIGKVPVPIDDAEIAAIQAAVGSGLTIEPWSYLEVGQAVRLEAGPLAGLEGILVEVRKKHRIVVSVTLLRRSMALEIEREWVAPSRADKHRLGFQIPHIGNASRIAPHAPA